MWFLTGGGSFLSRGKLYVEWGMIYHVSLEMLVPGGKINSNNSHDLSTLYHGVFLSEARQ